MQHRTTGDNMSSDRGQKSICNFAASAQGFSSVLQHSLLLSRLALPFFTLYFDALSLISMTCQSKPLLVCKCKTHGAQLYFRAGFNTKGHKGSGKSPQPYTAPVGPLSARDVAGLEEAVCKLRYEKSRWPPGWGQPQPLVCLAGAPGDRWVIGATGKQGSS